MDIRSAVAALREIQASLEISDPIEASIKNAWPYWVPKSAPSPEMPCFMNEWRLVKEDKTTNGVRELYYAIHSQLLVYDTREDRAADIATAFMPQIHDALDATLSLNGTVTWHDLRGGDPTLFTAQWGGRSFVGLDLFLDIRLTEGKTYGPYKTPKPDELVQARRKEGFGPVSMFSTPNLSAQGMVEAGHIVEMRFQEAVERDDFEPVGFEDLPADYFAEKEA